ncbi:MAG: hypothetical protein R3B09_20095 [Nannocystaceae bacterium]
MTLFPTHPSDRSPRAHRSLQGLTFLLSLGALPFGCAPETGETEGGGATESSTSGGTTTSTSTATTSSSSATTADSASATTTTGTTTDQGTDGITSTGGFESTGEDTTSTGGPLGPCDLYGASVLACDPNVDLDQVVEECEGLRDAVLVTHGALCVELLDALLTCPAPSCGEDHECDDEIQAFDDCLPPISDACAAWGTKYEECNVDEGMTPAKDCQLDLNEETYLHGPRCGAAQEELYACQSALECVQFQQGLGCEAEEAAAKQACGG